MEENNIEKITEEERLLIKEINKCQKDSKRYNILGAVSTAFGYLTALFAGSFVGNAIAGQSLFGKPAASYTLAGLLIVISALLFGSSKPYCDLRKLITDLKERDLNNGLNELQRKH